jgi:hypothetical protein
MAHALEIIFKVLLVLLGIIIFFATWLVLGAWLWLKEKVEPSKPTSLETPGRARTKTGFPLNFSLSWAVKRLDNKWFALFNLLNDYLGLSFGSSGTRKFLNALEPASMFFQIVWNEQAEIESPEEFSPQVRQGLERDGKFDLCNVQLDEMCSNFPSFEDGGYVLSLRGITLFTFDRDTIEENYAMLTEEQKAELEKTERLTHYEERLAVVALKRRQELLGNKKEVYETNHVSIETERAGRRLRIKWRFKPGSPAGYDLLGMRKTGGFFPDQWDTQNNGMLVIHMPSNGETTEVLNEGETYFYTFILKAWQETAEKPRFGVCRFQVSIETKEEREALETILTGYKERTKLDPEKETLSRALKEVGSYMEMDTAFEAMERSFVAQIEKTNYSEEVKEEKVARLRDLVRLVRDKYQ